MSQLIRLFILFSFIAWPSSIATAAFDASSAVSEFADKAIILMSYSDLSETERRDKFEQLVQKYFDLPVIGKFLLGKYWQTATQAEWDAYLKVFAKNIVYTYARQLDQYFGQRLVIYGIRKNGRFDIVSSRIVSPKNNEGVRLEWVVAKSNSTFKIIDVIIEGMSMSITQRQEYTSVIQANAGSIKALVDALSRQITE
ncbi:ABC-type transport system [Candidatus Endolissoclinum faulkneri L5]|uniref:ABC-type transport system n=1 Tax=Candidatus Endolissoclinum faulkneri L5 TaxID=1401328 RepID=V9TU02_9PROT|nr:ABC transporter substrate-binding protein [Candidatus Endolissoclinum faulkneri]AHC73642.1 ABC-type transport system [Candidatus Endolissoclinum faulkneri L5]